MSHSLHIAALVMIIGLSESIRAQIDSSLIRALDAHAAEYEKVAEQIWGFAELGYQETKSSALLQDLLKKSGFQVRTGVAGMPTAFTAQSGSGNPVIVILGEFDALPGLSQACIPREQPVESGAPGHGCGHHLFGTGSAAAVIALNDWLRENKVKGTIRFYGTPAEEGGGGKTYFVKAGLFDDVDAVLHWHPSSSNSADAESSLANLSAKFRFHGRAAHAAGAPQLGRSALDGVEAMNYMVNLLREHVSPESRIHYVITRGGDAPNVVPAFAEVFYYCRHPDMDAMRQNFDWLVKTAEGAALGTQTTMDYEIIHGLYSLLPNETLSRVMYKNLSELGGYAYTPEERAFAEQIMETLPAPANLENTKRIKPFGVETSGNGGSTDVGDVSWVVPAAGLRTATWVPGTGGHSWQAVAAGGMSIGTKGMMLAAKTMALTAADLFRDPSVLTTARAELERRLGSDFVYKSLVGDRKPPLDYRLKE